MSRFEDTLQRDLRVIADRATPSPHAWQQIQRRIVDQAPLHETEIIMLTDNTTRPRRWPILAAAAAVAALVVGGIALLNRADDDNAPSDDPTPATMAVPKPDDETGVDIEASTEASAEESDSTPDGEDAVPTRTVDLAGTFTAAYEVSEPDAEGVTTLAGTEDYVVGDTILSGAVAGSGVWTTATDATGTVETVFSGEIAGIGSGTITVEATFEQSDGVTDRDRHDHRRDGRLRGCDGYDPQHQLHRVERHLRMDPHPAGRSLRRRLRRTDRPARTGARGRGPRVLAHRHDVRRDRVRQRWRNVRRAGDVRG